MSTQLEGHTLQHFDGELHHPHVELLQMASLVLDQVYLLLEAFQQQNLDKLNLIQENKQQIDALEAKIDNLINELLATRGPMVRDLRALIGFSKAVTVLERVGYEAARSAHIALSLYEKDHSNPRLYLLREINIMGKLACLSLKEAIENLDTLELQRAKKLLASHDDLDEAFQAGLRRLTTFLLEDARNIGHTIDIVLILKSLERIGGHARNLAEYVVYIVSDQDIRQIEYTDEK